MSDFEASVALDDEDDVPMEPARATGTRRLPRPVTSARLDFSKDGTLSSTSKPIESGAPNIEQMAELLQASSKAGEVIAPTETPALHVESLDDTDDTTSEDDPEIQLLVNKEKLSSSMVRLRQNSATARKVCTGILIVIGVVVAIFIIIAAAGKREAGVQVVDAPYTQFSIEEFNVPATVYDDQIKLKKFARVENGSLMYYIVGKPKNFQQQVIINVSSAVYNAVKDDMTVKIQYQIVKLKMSGESKDFITNASVVVKGE